MDWSVFQAFVEEFRAESDRAAVILGAAKLDGLLGQILERYLLPSLSSRDELLEGDSPLATFSARINVTYRLGLITRDFAKALHQVRKIRNAFAHDLAGCSLDSGPHGDRVKILLLPLARLPFYHAFRERFFKNDESAGAQFRACLALMAARLEYRLLRVEPVSDEEAYQFVLDAWAEEFPPRNAKDGAMEQSGAT